MAKVWMAKEGADTTVGGPWRIKTLSECTEKLDLKPSNFLSSNPPKFGDVSKPPAMFRDPCAVVVKIDPVEATQGGWKAGFYVSELSPKEADRRVSSP